LAHPCGFGRRDEFKAFSGTPPLLTCGPHTLEPRAGLLEYLLELLMVVWRGRGERRGGRGERGAKREAVRRKMTWLDDEATLLLENGRTEYLMGFI